MKKIISFCLLLLGVEASIAQAIKVSIRGVVSENINELVLFKSAADGGSLDTAKIIKIKKGIFEERLQLPEAGLYILRINEKNVIMALEEGENVQIDATNKDQAIKVRGTSKGTLLLKEYADTEKKLSEKYLKPIENAYVKAAGDKAQQDSLQKAYVKTAILASKELAKMVLDKFGSSVALHYISLQWDDNTDMNTMAEISQRIQKKFPKTALSIFVEEKYKSLAATALGAEAMEIDLEDTEGKKIKLSSLRGKYVLLDFWAAWCGPCRAENPNLVSAYATYKSKGFEIYGVSLDDSKTAWEKAIAKDGLSWYNVSDLQGWRGIIVKKYSVTGIPMNFLLDKQGKIVAKNLRGESLKAKLKELMP